MRILYLDLDALTPSHLGCYGYHRNTSPTIDALAAGGVRCTQVYCSDAPCLPSRTAFYSGRFGIQTGVVGHGGTAANPRLEGPERGFRDSFHAHGLASRLQEAGFHTAMISPFGQRHAAWHFYAGFNEIHNTGRNGHESAEEVTPVVEKWLDAHAAQDRWYLHLNFWDIHTPYRVPASYGEPFAKDPLPDFYTDDLLARHRKMVGPHTAMDIGMYDGNEDPRHPRQPGEVRDRAELRRLIDGYDTAIRYVDDQIRMIVDRLKAAGVYDDTAIIVSADHGENFGQLGLYAEHGTADDGTCRVPMIIKWPGGRSGVIDEGLHYHLDWAPTLMELLGSRASEEWDGQSYAPTVRHGSGQGREQLVISQCAHVCQRGVRWGHWLYIRTYHDGFHLFPKEMLFDLQVDPMEQVNLADERREVCHEGVHRLAAWHDEQMMELSQSTRPDTRDPLWTVLAEGGPFHANPTHGLPRDFEAYLDRLERTGRAEGANALRQKYPQLTTR